MKWIDKQKLITEHTEESLKARNGFDVIRYFFAFSLILVHFCTLTDTPQFWFITGGTRVKAFFIITGFLVFLSILHSETLKIYFQKRIRRIVPAYVTCILFCLLIGMFFSTSSVGVFLTDGKTWKYLLSNLLFLNFLQPELPGVFQTNPAPAMNGSLWSMKVEVCFYMVLPLIAWMICRFRKGIVVTCLFGLSIIHTIVLDYLYESTGIELYNLLKHQLGGQMVYFLGGIVMLLWFDKLQKNVRWLLPLCLVLYLLRNNIEFLQYVEPITFALVIVGIAYYCPWISFLYGKDNISYGLYLYHFPIIQVLIHTGLAQYNIYLCFFTVVVLTIVASILSWKYIEKPLLYKRKKK